MTREEKECLLNELIEIEEKNDIGNLTRSERAEFQLWVKEIIEASKQEPKTGYWKQYGDFWEDIYKCSECGEKQPKILCGEQIIGYWSDYCPNCGAKMDREDEE